MMTSQKSSELRKSLSKFYAELYQKCAETSEDNLIISPYSIASAVALLSQGANGNTYDQIINALHLPNDKNAVSDLFYKFSKNFKKPEQSFTLMVAKHIYAQKGSKINEEFVEVAQNKYNSGISALDFANSDESAGTINRWVEIATNDKIKDLIKPDTLTLDTELILVNVLYFKGFWHHRFWKPATPTGPFYINDEDTVEAQYMHVRDGFDYAVLDDLDATAVSLRYYHSKVSFIVILPNKRDGLTELENKMKNYDLAKVTERLSHAEVYVTLPKFKFEFEVKLNNALKEMGMQGMFSNSADFSGMLDKRVKVSEVIHKAFIDVNEEGTEAGAATYMRCIPMCGRIYPRIHNFTVDHPFLFTISNGSTSLFTGRVRKV